MNLEKFTQKSQEAIFSAQQIAQEYHHQAIEPIHLELALIWQEGGVVLGHRDQSGQPTLAPARGTGKGTRQTPADSRREHAGRVMQAAADVLTAAERYAKGMSDEFVSTEHLLLGLTDLHRKASGWPPTA